jgi:predicted AAA+ superfamily ATPase
LKYYLEREVLKVYKIQERQKFGKFMQMIANMVGSPFDEVGAGNILGVDLKTVRRWINILIASYIIFESETYVENFEKRLTKRSKYYFYDCGLMSYLMGAKSEKSVLKNEVKGKFFENFIVSELKKKFINRGEINEMIYFWQTEKEGPTDEETPYEVDFIIKVDMQLFSIEVKCTDKLKEGDFQNMKRLEKLTPLKKFVIYTGPTTQIKDGTALHWMDMGKLLEI